MLNTISFIKANLQHSIAASMILTRTVGVKEIYKALIQKPRYRGGCMRGLEYSRLYLVLCKWARQTSGLHSYEERDSLDATRILLWGFGSNPAYLPYVYEDLPPSKEIEDLVRLCEKENLYLVVGCESNAHYSVWGSTNCKSRGEALVEFLNTTNLEIINLGNESTFCSGGRLEVIDVTLSALRLLESIIGWEVSSEPPLSNHKHILFVLWGS